MKFYKPMENYILWLSTEQNCTKRNSSDGAKTLEYSWDISPIILNEYASLKLFSIHHQTGTHGDNIHTVHLKDILYNPELYRTSENTGYPILSSSKWKQNETNYYSMEDSRIYIVPQTIRKINLVISNSITDPAAGCNSDMTFMIGICIEPYDRKLSDYEN